MIRILIAQMRKNMVAAQLRKQDSFKKRHTDPQAMMAGCLTVGSQVCPPEIGLYLSTWTDARVH